MISITKLLFSTEYFGDTLRYSEDSRGTRHGVTNGAGPVVVWNSTRTAILHVGTVIWSRMQSVIKVN